MTTGLIICGALGKEVVDIVDKHGWDAEVIGIPDQIAPKVEERILALRKNTSA